MGGGQYFFIDINSIEHYRHFLSSYLLLILSSCRISFLIFDRNWLIRFLLLIITHLFHQGCVLQK